MRPSRGFADGAAKEALELWHGAPLADVAAEPFAPDPRSGGSRSFTCARSSSRSTPSSRPGATTRWSAELEALIAEEPLRERFHAQRMLALYRAGRQSEALEAYRQAHRTLSEEIGVEPGPELRRLQEQILAQDPALDAPAPAAGAAAPARGRLAAARRARARAALAARALGSRRARGGSSCALVWGPAGIGKTRLVAELAAEVQRAGAAVLYAGGGEVADAALATVAEAAESHRPTLLVLDYADDAPPAVLAAAAALAREPEGRPLLICVLHHDEQGPPAFAGLLETRRRPAPATRSAAARTRRRRSPRSTHPPRASRCRCETLIAESEGVPLRIHRAAGEWARAEAAERLAATAGRAADERSELRATQAAVAGSVVDLQAARERTRLYAVEEPPGPVRAARSVLTAAWRPSTPPTPSTSSAASASSPSSSPASSARPCSRWSAPRGAASPRRSAPGCCRRSRAGSFPARRAGAGR